MKATLHQRVFCSSIILSLLFITVRLQQGCINLGGSDDSSACTDDSECCSNYCSGGTTCESICSITQTSGSYSDGCFCSTGSECASGTCTTNRCATACQAGGQTTGLITGCPCTSDS
mmetsp:Transcript_21745/g.16077  ORF Transcript_21745/g.16077 Transcript_21745/m.16077 type:complete len:117 (-) Transcript_21745:5714-6064(-)